MVTAPPQMSSPLTGSVDLSRINSIRLATTRQTYDAALKFVLFLKIADVENLLPLSDNPRSYQISHHRFFSYL